jgi:hypothetical protein
MHLLDFFTKYKYIDINPGQAWDDINDMVHAINRSADIKDGKPIRYDYPLGNKNLITLSYISKYFISMKERNIIKGVASLTIKDIYLNGSVTRVAYLSDLRIANDFCTTGKRQWRNAFLDLIVNKDKIVELKECEFIYGLIDIENELTKNLFNRFEKLIDINYINNYSIHNIFTKKNEFDVEDSEINVELSTIENKEELTIFSLNQIQDRRWCDSPKNNISNLEDYIVRNQSIHIKKDGKVIAHSCFMRTQVSKLELTEISSKFKMAKSILPLFSSKPNSEDECHEKLNSIYISKFDICNTLTPLERIELAKILIQNVINSKHHQKDSILTLSCIQDRAIEKALESFISITKKMKIISFKRKEDVITIEDDHELLKVS